MAEIEHLKFASDDELAQAAAKQLLDVLADSKRASFSVALSGGRIARKLSSAIAANLGAKQKLERVHFFWGDERCVPPNDPESNFRIADELIFSPLKIDPGHIHRVKGELEPEEAAREAETELKRFVPVNQNGFPIIDLIFLGMGEDGHTASLFPSEPESAGTDPAIYRHVVASKPPPHRVTLGYGPIIAAHGVWVLASGAAKEAALRESLSSTGMTPLARVLQRRQHTKVFSDIKV
jgi:6-phosphogluconolactonase